MDGRERDRGEDEPQPRLQGASEKGLFADAGRQGDGRDADRVVEATEEALIGVVDLVGEVRGENLAQGVDPAAEGKEEAGRRHGEEDLPGPGPDQAESVQ